MNADRTRINWEAAKQHLREAESAVEKSLAADAAMIEEVYRVRALQMARRHTESATDEQTERLLVFSLGAETYGIAIADLAEVLPATKCTPVPRAAAEIAGVINLRGELRSVIDLGRLLSTPQAAGESGNCILMLRNGRDEVGLNVGQVQKVQTIREDELASPENGGADGASNFIKGLTPDKVIVLNASALRLHPVFGSAPSSSPHHPASRPRTL